VFDGASLTDQHRRTAQPTQLRAHLGERHIEGDGHLLSGVSSVNQRQQSGAQRTEADGLVAEVWDGVEALACEVAGEGGRARPPAGARRESTGRYVELEQ
jgi:hypothetical protein